MQIEQVATKAGMTLSDLPKEEKKDDKDKTMEEKKGDGMIDTTMKVPSGFRQPTKKPDQEETKDEPKKPKI